MLNKQLLCVSLGKPAAPLVAGLAWDDWTVHAVASLKEASRVLREQSFLVGLLLGMAHGDAPDEIDSFLRQHWAMQWIGVFPPHALQSPDWRRLVADHCCDFHTLPIDPLRLSHTLGHAHGHAALREAPAAGPARQRDMPLKGHGGAILRLRRQIAQVAGATAPVLIWGESGSGKELTAQAIHAQSPRAAGPFVPINCGAIPASLIQSELFGHERGAFTGAACGKRGLIESAAGGTVFLDEIGDLPMELQSNLLRFLQEKTIYRLGSTQSIEVDVRVIAASHVNLQKAVAGGTFREDLYYRLNVLALDVPPLRERREDLLLLTNHFFTLYADERAPRVKGFSGKALEAIKAHDWPGNVRELINRVRRAAVMAEGRLISPQDLGLEVPPRRGNGEALDGIRLRAERAAIEASLQRSGKNISQAARELGVSRMTLYRLLAKHGIDS
ncbi:sigma-54 dependent transcriptional regulator [Janthinobacterium fluminis]|uniref:Sigma-54 dependent transcriptional regulator n=1 Tax=Janthinobacterium fluminis TaxID=2987524 RepID=A0ABT5K7F8_9BURK|nr:sigma-54 dependent transcriptional regulator [Janthinobacterium fluminis]MDC8760937.1 sigma-54 dependent transcriptional regulator [Janthinobacterium fluminis]